MPAEDIEIQLWEYIDGSCSQAEKERVAALIAQDTAWKNMHEELLAFHQSVQTDMMVVPASPEFADKVMDKILSPAGSNATQLSMLTWGIRAVVAFFIISISTVLVAHVATADFSITAPSPANGFNFEKIIPSPGSGTVSMFTAFAFLLFLLLAADSFFRNKMLRGSH